MCSSPLLTMKAIISKRLIGTLFLLLIFPIVKSGTDDLFTAQVELESLLETQGELIEVFESYISKEEVRIRELKRRLLPFIETKRQEPSAVVGNPVSAFRLLKGLTVDLDDLITLADLKTNANELRGKIDKLKEIQKFPTNDDLNGAAIAVTRLQDTYLLETKDIAQGNINGHYSSAILNADDCFELGRQTYNSGDHDHTILWMNEALQKSQEERSNGSNAGRYNDVSPADILDYLAFSNYQKGQVSLAIRLTEQLIELEPNHPRAATNIEHYKKLLDKKGEDEDILTDKTFTVREKREVDKVGWEKAKYEGLCRGENQTPQWKAKCYYFTNNVPYYFIGPIKEEIVSVNPTIHIFYDVMLDSEIEEVKKLALPRLKRATVHNHLTGELVTAQYRISKSAWLQHNESPVVARVNTRVAGITGLELNTAEELQVVNYGLGGHYEPHFDFARRDEKDAFKTLGTGNRIATFLFYMSDVEAGGATVFPSINLSVWPKKGSAAFWYNLKPDGTGDFLTRHAACPVLLGSKWVSNKWIHERGQEFRRPCELVPNELPVNSD